ncbi:MAG: c-type cytochrome [Burkholderiales bacterium]
MRAEPRPSLGRRSSRGGARRAAAAAALAALLVIAPGVAKSDPNAETLAKCAACHGPGGNTTVPQFPSIAGQPATFIENQLVIMREGLRDVPAMKEVVAGMKDEEIVELAKHFAAQPFKPNARAPDAEKARLGAEIARARLCSTCHLANYSGQQQVPRIGGQNEAYLVESMKQFRDNPGPGRDTIMASTLRGLTDADLASLANHLANFKP